MQLFSTVCWGINVKSLHQFKFRILLLLSLLIIPATPAYAQDATLTPKEVVEYALTLEKLEADFYQRAITATHNGGLSNLPDAAKNAITSYGQDETQHVIDLSAVLKSLGGNPA